MAAQAPAGGGLAGVPCTHVISSTTERQEGRGRRRGARGGGGEKTKGGEPRRGLYWKHDAGGGKHGAGSEGKGVGSPGAGGGSASRGGWRGCRAHTSYHPPLSARKAGEGGGEHEAGGGKHHRAGSMGKGVGNSGAGASVAALAGEFRNW